MDYANPTTCSDLNSVNGGLMGMSGVFVPYNAGPVSTSSTSTMYNTMGGASGQFATESAGVVSNAGKGPPIEMP